MARLVRVLALCASIVGVSGFAQAQGAVPAAPQTPPAAAPAADLLRVFLDCNECDEDYIRQNVAFIDYVRDRAVADLHVLVTTQETGGGGRSWTVKFIGLGKLQGQDRSLGFTTPQTATPDDRRKEFARIFKIGLVAYAAATSVSKDLDVTWKRPAAALAPAPTKDRWNYWVFRTNLNGNLNGERSSRSHSYRVNFSGNRTTDAWKVNLNSNANYDQNVFEVPEENLKVKSDSSNWNVNAMVVKSLSPRLSFGGRASANHSSFSNNARSFVVAPGVEYNVFPYSESARRAITLQYTIGMSQFKYRDLTIYDKRHDTVPNHRISSAIAFRQPWGSVELESSLGEHLNHLDRYRASFFGGADVRLFKGFSFNLFGQYEKINDQISLRKESVSTAEVLLRNQQLATSYSYFLSFGISYSFGSIFNSVVNTRFGGGG